MQGFWLSNAPHDASELEDRGSPSEPAIEGSAKEPYETGSVEKNE
jgi:hypothetical protein